MICWKAESSLKEGQSIFHCWTLWPTSKRICVVAVIVAATNASHEVSAWRVTWHFHFLDFMHLWNNNSFTRNFMILEDHHIDQSPLSQIRGLKMVSQFPLDPMHLIFLKVIRKLPQQWVDSPLEHGLGGLAIHYNMTAMVLAGNEINFAIAAGLIRLHMPGGK